MTIEIPLCNGGVSLIDDADYALVSQYRWANRGSPAPYARCDLWKNNERQQIWMHRLVMNPPADLEVDHKNMDGLDNRRANLRIATSSLNCANRSNNRKGGYRGVYSTEREGVFQVRLTVRPKCHYLGRFECEIEAARAYDRAALAAFGEFARLNFPAEAA